MKEGFIHLIFVIDESGSMYGSTNDVKGSFKTTIDEQRKLTDGKCAISIFKFADSVKNVALLKDVNEIDELEYTPDGCTAMNDGIGHAIVEVGKKLAEMDESERPEKNLVVIMTDGEENSSKEYKLEQVRDMIKEQTEKYNWNFMYVGTDITDSSYSNSLFHGLANCNSVYTSRDNYVDNMNFLSVATCSYRMSTSDTQVKNEILNKCIDTYCDDETSKYENEVGKKIR